MGVALLDSLFRATGLEVAEVEALARRHPGARNCRRLLEVLPYVDGGAESIPESRLRLLLCRAGLPRPETQIKVSKGGAVFARLDMGWRRWQVGVEYDGAQHWTDPRRRTLDLARYNDLPALGWTIIRANATLLHTHPHDLVRKITTALHNHGYRPPSGT
ncbi:hypothetical protein ACWELJ_02820 [Nocardia sp. NPDC004582]